MKRAFYYVFFGIVVSCIFSSSVLAKEYTKDDVEDSLNKIMGVFEGVFPVGTEITMNSTDSETVITSTFDGKSYVTHFGYADGVYSYVSEFSDVTNEEEFLKSGFDTFNISLLLAGILSTYDAETIESAKDASVGDVSNVNTFTLEKDGLQASLISSSIKEIEIGGNKVDASGFLKTLQIDINHKSLIKLLTDNNGDINFGGSIKDPSATPPTEPDNENDNNNTNPDDNNNNDNNSGGIVKPDTDNNNSNSGNNNKPSTTVPNPQTGLSTFGFIFLMIMIVSLGGFIYIKKYDVFKKIK